MFKKVLFLTIFLSSIVWANGLKNFADGVVSVKESGGNNKHKRQNCFIWWWIYNENSKYTINSL